MKSERCQDEDMRNQDPEPQVQSFCAVCRVTAACVYSKRSHRRRVLSSTRSAESQAQAQEKREVTREIISMSARAATWACLRRNCQLAARSRACSGPAACGPRGCASSLRAVGASRLLSPPAWCKNRGHDVSWTHRAPGCRVRISRRIWAAIGLGSCAPHVKTSIASQPRSE